MSTAYINEVPGSQAELIRIFQDAEGTTGGAKIVRNRIARWWHGTEKDEDLIVGRFENGDLVMKYTEYMGEATSNILSLSIVDTKAGFSGGAEVLEKDDLVHKLRVMQKIREQQK